MTAQRRTLDTPALIAPSAWPDTMGVEEAARYLRLGVDSTRALWEAGELPGTSLNQKHLVFRRAALDRFLADQERLQQAAHRAAQAHTPDAAANDEPRRPGRKRRALPALDRYDT